jgi:hypothetical protein
MISAWAAERVATRMAITVAGMSCTEPVLMAQKSACASVAVPGWGLSRSSSSIALMPNGVAALPSPRRFAETFITMAPMAGWSGGMEGNSLRSTGRATRASIRTSPASSATRISPSQRVKTPTSVRA